MTHLWRQPSDVRVRQGLGYDGESDGDACHEVAQRVLAIVTWQPAQDRQPLVEGLATAGVP